MTEPRFEPLADEALLRRFEPVLRFTRGEEFLPMDVKPYVQACSLWAQRPDEQPQQLVDAAHLDLARLAYPYPDEFGTIHYLQLVEPAIATKEAIFDHHERIPEAREPFRAGLGRLARVGYGSRLIDALFSISLLARGRVPGATAAAAARAYQRLGVADEHLYYGRVVREGGWTVLQYWFFYLFNNWRSGFYGANDHESDWEMICIYLAHEGTEDDATHTLQPIWVAYASHDYAGDDLRRRWDDPEVQKVGAHPVIYVGAGSHASYFSPGEYLTEIELPFLAPLVRLTDRVQRFWHKQLRQYGGETGEGAQPLSNIFRIPFVDYARGDGLTIGPGQARPWRTPYLLNPTPPWVSQYRGLWGLYTHDPFAGEDAPAGPMYNRNGSVRRAWYDPVGWAGLDKVPPPPQLMTQLLDEQAALRQRLAAYEAEIEAKAQALQGMGLRAMAMRTQPHLSAQYTLLQQQIETQSEELNEVRRAQATDHALLEALAYYATGLRVGKEEPLRAHLRRAHRPASAERLRFSRLAEVWAAGSIGLMLVLFVGLAVFGQQYLIFGLLASVSLFTVIEAGFRGRLTQLITSVTIALSIAATLVIIYEFYWPLVMMTVLTAGGYILWDNLRELWR
jgi:DNA-binding protein H-NS